MRSVSRAERGAGDSCAEGMRWGLKSLRLLLRGEHGSVTAEFAAAVPAVVLVLACGLSSLQIAGQQLRLQDAAADVARLLARGDSARIPGIVARAAPGASYSMFSEGDLVCARLRVEVTSPVGALLRLSLGAQSCALGGGR